MTLTAEEYNVLNKIATRTGMDCWFFLKQDKNGNDYVYDIEGDPGKKRMSLKKGIAQLAEGFFFDYTEEEFDTILHMSIEEVNTFKRLCEKLKIQTTV